MKILSAFRILAVPLGGALSFGLFMPFISGLHLVIVGMLLGFIGSMLVGIPLLLIGDRCFPGFKARHVLSSVLQILFIYVLYSGFQPRLWIAAVAIGVVLGLLYTAFDRYLVRYAARSPVPQMGNAYVWGIPICAGIPLAIVAMLILSDGSSGHMAALILFFLVGMGIGMLVGWPVLWLTDRLLTHRLRYIVGGTVSGFLIWLLFGAPGLLPLPTGQYMNYLMDQPGPRMLTFVWFGCASGLLFTGYDALYSRFILRRGATGRQKAVEAERPAD